MHEEGANARMPKNFAKIAENISKTPVFKKNSNPSSTEFADK